MMFFLCIDNYLLCIDFIPIFIYNKYINIE